MADLTAPTQTDVRERATALVEAIAALRDTMETPWPTERLEHAIDASLALCEAVIPSGDPATQECPAAPASHTTLLSVVVMTTLMRFRTLHQKLNVLSPDEHRRTLRPELHDEPKDLRSAAQVTAMSSLAPLSAIVARDSGVAPTFVQLMLGH